LFTSPEQPLGLSPSPVIHEYLIKDLEDVEKVRFILPDPRKFSSSNFKEMIEIVGDRGILEVHPGIGMGGPALSTVMGMENAMVSFYENRQLFDALLQIFHDYHQQITRAMLEAGAPLIFMSWHDYGVSGGWSPKIWRPALPLIKISSSHSYDALYTYFTRRHASILVLMNRGDIVSTLLHR
jgi:hypothetical protein